MKTELKIDQDKQGVYDQAESLLDRAGVTKEDVVPRIWNAFHLQTVQLLMDGYQERYILHKLEERAIGMTNALKTQRGENDAAN